MLKVSRWIKTAITLNDAYKLFNMNEKSTIDDLKNTYRNLSLKYHPDHGGDKNKMSTINQAKELIENYLLNKQDTSQQLTSIQNNIKSIQSVITRSFNDWENHLKKYINDDFKLTFDEKIDTSFYIVTANVIGKTVQFIIKFRCFNPYGKIAIHYNVRIIDETIRTHTVVPENNRRLTLHDLAEPEFFFPDNVMRILYPIIVTDNYKLVDRNKVIELLLAIGAKKLDERTFQLGSKVIQRNDTKNLKTPSWTVQDDGNTRIYIETLDHLTYGQNIKKMLKYLQS